MSDQKTQTEIISNRIREVVISSFVETGDRATWAGVRVSQEDWCAAALMGTLEAIAVVLAEVFKNDRERLAHIFPRCEMILSRTAEHVWTTGHVPGCDCPDQHRG